MQSYVFPGVGNVICKDMGTIYRAKLQQESTKRESYSYFLYCTLLELELELELIYFT